MRLQGRVALITGAASGIGRRSASLFAKEGACVVVADLEEKLGRETVEEINGSGGCAVFAKMDVTEPSSVEACVRAAVGQFGRLDVLYNNVGGTLPGDGFVDSVSLDILWSSLSRDLFGTFVSCRYALPEIIAAGGGAIINTASLVALIGSPVPSAACYAAAKGGVVSLTRTMAVQYAPHKVRVNAIAPGATSTERVARLLEDGVVPPALVDRHLLGIVEPIDVANAALFLASDESRMITGQILAVDSGVTMS